MKTIEVTDEMYNSLMGLSKEINTQDHRFTCMPYIFQIRTTEQVPAAEGCGTEAWVSDGTLIHGEEDIRNAVFEWKDWDLDNPDHKGLYDDLSGLDVDDIMENNWRKMEFSEEDKYQNAFLTAKACKEHIERNYYHYTQPVDYLSGAFRNPELELVFKFLCELTGGKIHR